MCLALRPTSVPGLTLRCKRCGDSRPPLAGDMGGGGGKADARTPGCPVLRSGGVFEVSEVGSGLSKRQVFGREELSKPCQPP